MVVYGIIAARYGVEDRNRPIRIALRGAGFLCVIFCVIGCCVVETRTQLVVEECFLSVHKSVCFLCWFIGADLSAVMFLAAAVPLYGCV